MIALAGLIALNPAFGAEDEKPKKTATELAKQDQNPLARVLRVTIEDNMQFGFGPENGVLNFLRIQPTVAFDLSKSVSLVTRTIVPIVHRPEPNSADGLGDIGLQLFLTPRKFGKFIWGGGPGFFFPSAVPDTLGTEKWSAGPSAIVVTMTGRWIVGAIANQLWSFAGANDRRGVNVLTVRPYVNYNLSHGWFLVSSPSIVASWNATDVNHLWLIPVGGGFGKAFPLGSSHGLNTVLEAYYHVISPPIGPDWQLRFQVTVLFPK